jgi:hypothetical protein
MHEGSKSLQSQIPTYLLICQAAVTVDLELAKEIYFPGFVLHKAVFLWKHLHIDFIMIR